MALSWVDFPNGVPISGYVLEAGRRRLGTELGSFGVSGRSLVANVAPGTYFVRVRAVGPNGTSIASADRAFTIGQATCRLGGPAPPIGFTHAVSGQVVALEWSPSAAPGAAYIIEAGSRPGASDLYNAPFGGTRIVVSAPPGDYYVRLRTRDACGVSVPSAERLIVIGDPPPTTCGYRLAPRTQTAPAAGGSFSAQIVAAPGCQWRLSSDGEWINLLGVRQGTGAAAFSFSVSANAGTARSARIFLEVDRDENQILYASQEPAPTPARCRYTVAPSRIDTASQGGVYSVSVTTLPECAWSARSDEAWLLVRRDAGSGPGIVEISVKENPSPSPRTATLLIQGDEPESVTITQARRPCPPSSQQCDGISEAHHRRE